MKKTKVFVAGIHFVGMQNFISECTHELEFEFIPESALEYRIHECDVLIPAMSKIDANLIEKARNLKLIHQWGAGLDGVDIESASKKGIYVANVPTANTGNAESVAEWAIMSAIALSRGFPNIQNNVYNAVGWGCPVGTSLIGKKALIVGFGGIGRSIATRLKPFGVHIYAIKQNIDANLALQYRLDAIDKLSKLEQYLEIVDYVFLALPLNDSTRELINSQNIFKIKKGAFLINPSRGAIVEKKALIDALNKNHLGGVALDVFWKEPPEKEEFFDMKNVIVTPHIAGVTDVSYKAIAFYVCENIKRVSEGKKPLNCVNC
ncbi:2-hydroxyacid dehydrogenase [Desulfurella sp.]|uniref:2-hydroxyacid dehydrogenase n=1 Tax=Desulfurella sp. TaxID=1962857 RepID=UPI003D0C9C53